MLVRFRCAHAVTHAQKDTHAHTHKHTHMLAQDAQKEMQAGRQARGVSVRRMHIKGEGQETG